MNKLLYTNDYSLWGNYIKNQKSLSFNNFDEYKIWLDKKTNIIKIININNLDIFQNLKLQSKSQLINYEKIYNWWFNIKRNILFYPKKQLQYYNFYNFTLYLMSRNHFNYNNQKINHNLKIEIQDNRCATNNSVINFLIIKNKSNIWENISLNNSNIFFKIDYSSSFIQILSVILQCPIDYEDKYYYFYKELNIKGDYDRNKIKTEVFKILFSNGIKKHLNIQFFQKAYNFSIYLQEQYIRNGYINSLISEKKIILDNQNSNTRKSLLLNNFIMSLETQLYIGVLYNLLNIDSKNIKPIIFIHDSFIFQINNNIEEDKIKKINKVLKFNDLLNVSQYIGDKLNNLNKIC